MSLKKCTKCPRLKTGWPHPTLMQDDCRELSIWFATRIDARWTLTHRVYA